jgi:hypothetical protein
MEAEPAPVPGEDISGEETAAPVESSTDEHVVKGKTTFGELIEWGVPQEVMEPMIGAPMPDPAVKVKDFATESGLHFETLKTQLQGEVDKIKP